ncbi:Ankrd13a [Symbiodinium microadriaticum]|nr:Ankrd13a [Symbiodinium microadriaticum]
MGGVVKMFAPDDTYRIWKKGSWLRLDSTIAGFNRNFSAKRGQLSTIFRGRRGSVQLGSGEVPLMGGDMENGEEEGDLLHVDRSDMTFQRVLKKLQRPREDDLARAADRLIRAKEKHNMVNAFDLDASHWHIRALKDMRGKVKKVRVDDGEYEKWEAKGEVQVRIDAKRDNSSLINLTEDEYFLRTPASASGRADVIAEEAETDCEQLATKRGSTPIGGGDKRVKSKSRTRTLKKHINIGLLMTNTSPISMRELMPILEVFSWRNEFIAKLRSIFGGKEVQVPDGSFPFRTQIPLLVGVSAVATFGRVERIDSGSGCGCIDDNIFSVPASEFHETVDTVVDTHP